MLKDWKTGCKNQDKSKKDPTMVSITTPTIHALHPIKLIALKRLHSVNSGHPVYHVYPMPHEPVSIAVSAGHKRKKRVLSIHSTNI